MVNCEFLAIAHCPLPIDLCANYPHTVVQCEWFIVIAFFPPIFAMNGLTDQ